MSRPSFQFYPDDWLSNLKLKRCSEGAQGVWIKLLCAFHDSDEYGVLRWPLAEIIHTVGVPKKYVFELIKYGVLKGSDTDPQQLDYTPVSARKRGDTVILLQSNQDEPCWYSSRFVVDEYKRNVRAHSGKDTQFSSENQPEKNITKPSSLPSPKPAPKHGKGDGSTSSSSSSSKNKTPLTTLSNFDKATVDNSKIICGQLRLFEIQSLDPTNVRLLRLIQEGATSQTFLDAVVDIPIGKPLNYLLTTIERTWWKRSDQSILDTAKRLDIPTQGLKRSELITKCEAKLSRVHTFDTTTKGKK